MEGFLSVPPDRGTIIGRAMWKPRYMVVGGPQRDQTPGIARAPSNRSSAPKELFRVPSEGVYLSIYKSKEDQEPSQQYSINSITDCQVQMMAHRKQGPVLPTLVINIIPDPAADKLRKRRSSRTAGFTSNKDTGPTQLLFRAVDEPPQQQFPRYTLQDWARFVQQLIQPNMPGRTPLSPVTPASPTFVNPFTRPRELSDTQRSDGGNAGPRPGFTRGHTTHSGRDRPVTFSDSPSLRSKRSDISSATSSIQTHNLVFQNYTTMLPTDLPSPATTIGEYQGEFIEGWTSAQGRSSALSSPVRERGSVGSGPTPLAPIMDAGTSPPGPRETILDRAFQMRRIPGSEREVPGEEKLTSLARFDALMRDMDDKRKQREAEDARQKAQTAAAASASVSALNEQSGLKSAWDLDESSSEYDDDDDDDDSDGPFDEADLDDDQLSPQPNSAQRALDYISGRPDLRNRPHPPPRTHSIRTPLSYNHEALMALSSNSGARPQTGYSGNRTRPGMSQRTHSQPQLATIMASSPSTAAAEDSLSTLAPGSPPPLQRNQTEKRQSNSSAKRLSFSEFTKRLSSTSSLLLVQTNTSNTSSRGSNSDAPEPSVPQSPPQHLHHLHPRAAPPPPLAPQSPTSMSERDRCGWRGSVGVFGAGEGGFL
ncbi:hypothetical protein QBC40DRAFT_104503 [Triangularia verruculosa]|uniref:PH domain-containing protein n=1 Tax=Triangularia verruculosa TaxID=2587418 RepID=A0AAN6XP45_9PEZI|nr:hypothetical protein QBC40DRAFT_104503 [Triangularia verruculosa]